MPAVPGCRRVEGDLNTPEGRALWLGGSLQLLCASHAVGMPCAGASTREGTWGFASGLTDRDGALPDGFSSSAC